MRDVIRLFVQLSEAAPKPDFQEDNDALSNATPAAVDEPVVATEDTAVVPPPAGIVMRSRYE